MSRKSKTPYELFEWFMEVNAKLPRETILVRIAQWPSSEALKKLSDDDLRMEYCEATVASIEAKRLLPLKFRVVRHTFNAQGKLAERAVISGSHATHDNAKAALQAEAARHPRHEVQPDSGNCKITDKFGKDHWILIEGAIA